MTTWFDYVATAKILFFGLVAGATLPALFALGVRLGPAGDGESAPPPSRHSTQTVLRWAIFALLAAIVVAGVLFIARDFIEHRIGWQWDDWNDWDDVFEFDD
ncbi:hypothetical protein H7J77_18070 [Mycolicibacillus parakoreensis]|uniref:Transmembrane protein n=1 Tax=Mycolicibacillus parakoreensis TaxID=1069221 RepID=A0ABY3U752_9MYCO|nr:hypothetical protein [Mycolicibacillus parakoreensis]MCV7317443.1 hypothetical protein [Mycolicibacillus parakoreensis]ULN53937.1 hypothetical protein MIU77_06490 [Mycolicibacillus parakoreensis]